jgi:hypothetical protein
MTIAKNLPNTLNHIGSGFTVILNETIDVIPTKGALGIYLYLSRKPQDWIIREKDLQNRFSCGRDSIRSDLKVLHDVGLYDKQAIRDESGKIAKWVTNLYNSVKSNPQSNQICEENKSKLVKDHHITEKPQCGFHDMSQNPPHTNERSITNEKINTNSSSSVDDGFCDFWEQYPKKIAKAEAKKAWCKVKPDLRQKIIQDIALRKQNNWKSLDKQFIPNAASYLRAGRWTDEIIPQATKVTPRSSFMGFNELKSTVPLFVREAKKETNKVVQNQHRQKLREFIKNL